MCQGNTKTVSLCYSVLMVTCYKETSTSWVRKGRTCVPNSFILQICNNILGLFNPFISFFCPLNKFKCSLPISHRKLSFSLSLSTHLFTPWVLKCSKCWHTDQIKWSLEENMRVAVFVRTWGSQGAIFPLLGKSGCQFYPFWLEVGNTWWCQVLQLLQPLPYIPLCLCMSNSCVLKCYLISFM